MSCCIQCCIIILAYYGLVIVFQAFLIMLACKFTGFITIEFKKVLSVAFLAVTASLIITLATYTALYRASPEEVIEMQQRQAGSEPLRVESRREKSNPKMIPNIGGNGPGTTEAGVNRPKKRKHSAKGWP